MKKRLLLWLPLFLGACTEMEESPVITIEKLYAHVGSGGEPSDIGKENYANRPDELPVLKVGDEVRAFLLLNGNGADLKSFNLQNDEGVDTKLFFEKSEVSADANLTDAEKGQLRFKDGVSKAKVMVVATIKQVDRNGDVKLEFFLSSKAECEGAQEEIGLRTETSE